MRKKLLFLITDLGGGGAEKVLVNLVNNLDVDKYDITVKTVFDTGVNRDYIKKHVQYCPGLKKQPHGNVIIMRMLPPKFLYKFFIRDDYDCVISFLEGPTSRIISGCTDNKTKKIAWIHVEHSDISQLTYPFKSKAEAECAYNKMDLIVCVANTVKDNFKSLLNITAPIITAYNVNDSENIREKGNESINDLFNNRKINVISVGRLISVKGFDRLIRVHKRLLDNGIVHNIYILGDGNGREHLKTLIKQNRLEKTFHLLGYDNNPYKYIAKADLFVCSSLREGFSTAVTEALILGVPVVSTNVSGATELLGKNNEYGLVTENNEDSLYLGIKAFLENSELRSVYKKRAMERGKMFDRNKTIQNVEKIIDEVLAKEM